MSVSAPPLPHAPPTPVPTRQARPIPARVTGPSARQAGTALRITEDPFTAMVALACAGVRDRGAGLDTAAARTVAGLTEAESRAVSLVVGMVGPSAAPGCLLPARPGTDTDVDRETRRLLSLPDEDVALDLRTTFGPDLPPGWAEVAGAPRRWTGAVAGAVRRLWDRSEPAWRRQHPLRRREGERMAFAAARGLVTAELDRLPAESTAPDRRVTLPAPGPSEPSGAGPRTVVLAPSLAGLDISLVALRQRGPVWCGYSPATGAVDTEALSALLTPLRAELLLMLGDGERSASELSGALYAAPPTISYQVTTMITAGLITRRKAGRRSLISRTRTGDALVEAYAAR